MPKVTDFTIRELGPRRFLVNIPAQYSETGKRQRRVFTTERRAEAERDRLKKTKGKFGTSLAMLPAADLADARRALDLLEGTGLTLTAAAHAALDARQRRIESVPLSALEDAFLGMLERNGRSASYRSTIRGMLGRLREATGDVPVADVSQDHAKEFLRPMTGASQKATKRHLHAAFAYAVEEGWAAGNVFSGLRTADAKREAIIALTAAESEALVKAADERIKPFVILATWCGIRVAELMRLDWSEVRFEKGWVDVRQGVSKTGRRRQVELADNVVAMLKPHRRDSGPVVPVSRDWLNKLQADARKGAEVKRWQRHVLRHTFASHWLTHNGDDMDGLARRMGHTSNETAHQHYLDAVDKDDAIKFWGVGLPPEKRKENAAKTATNMKKGAAVA